jgi:hypothetical protein
MGKETSNGKEGEMSQAETSERRNGDTPLGYSGQAALEGRNVMDLINALPGNSSVNTVQHATVEEAVFCRSDRRANILAG